MSGLNIVTADYRSPRDRRAITELMDCYARDPMGGGQPITPDKLAVLCDHLAAFPGAVTLLAYDQDRALGLVTAFPGFSTFRCAPLFNIHDVVVVPEARGQGICRQMLAALEGVARDRGCCKLTLEVLAGNEVARGVYARIGFAGYALDPAAGEALFWEKSL
ncbi:GNAT family N-acetyltransferase [Spongiibacter taiwanensis]|uniref:GNAT family N-acetyltransferase n=1 Tax=Spongiibacter taiwanensis TaxID=1748242 RepID=UPI0020360B95|nr:GNAT family N-acetyltransferase [Spongiibacter taiwanensis]USA42527.1 GNAT family N-acetyltransferase [Spongiibacter taiwanensis]